MKTIFKKIKKEDSWDSHEGYSFSLFRIYLDRDFNSYPKILFGLLGIQYNFLITLFNVDFHFKYGWLEINIFNQYQLFIYRNFNSYLLEDENTI